MSVSNWPLLCSEAFSGLVTANTLSFSQSWIRGIMVGHKISGNHVCMKFQNSTRHFKLNSGIWKTPESPKTTPICIHGETQLQFPDAIFHFENKNHLFHGQMLCNRFKNYTNSFVSCFSWFQLGCTDSYGALGFQKPLRLSSQNRTS